MHVEQCSDGAEHNIHGGRHDPRVVREKTSALASQSGRRRDGRGFRTQAPSQPHRAGSAGRTRSGPVGSPHAAAPRFRCLGQVNRGAPQKRLLLRRTRGSSRNSRRSATGPLPLLGTAACVLVAPYRAGCGQCPTVASLGQIIARTPCTPLEERLVLFPCWQHAPPAWIQRASGSTSAVLSGPP